MVEVEIESAAAQFSELVNLVRGGEEVVITDRSLPVARLVPPIRRRKLGTAAGQVVVSPDFDAPLDDFKEYA